jgi:hypothetical protein
VHLLELMIFEQASHKCLIFVEMEEDDCVRV